jgi:hypothetical protein
VEFASTVTSSVTDDSCDSNLRRRVTISPGHAAPSNARGHMPFEPTEAVSKMKELHSQPGKETEWIHRNGFI